MKNLKTETIARLNKTAPEYLSSYDVNPAWDAVITEHGFGDNDFDYNLIEQDTPEGKAYCKAFQKAQDEADKIAGNMLINKVYAKHTIDISEDGTCSISAEGDNSNNWGYFSDRGFYDPINRLAEWLEGLDVMPATNFKIYLFEEES